MKLRAITVMTGLDAAMIAKQATVQALADRAGVCIRTVHLARHGKPVKPFIAECIWQALNDYQYGYIKGSADNLAGRHYGRRGKRAELSAA